MSEYSDNNLKHTGTPQMFDFDPNGSGRYRQGEGNKPFQHWADSDSFLERVKYLESQGLTQTQIAESFNMKTPQFRAYNSLAIADARRRRYETAVSLEAQGYSRPKIAEMMGLPGESSVRSLLNSESKSRMNKAMQAADNLKKLVDEKGMIDVGTGTERQLGMSAEKMNQALEILKARGYEVYGAKMPQVTNKDKFTNIKVLCPPGTEHKEIYEWDQIHSIDDYTTRDDGDTLEPSFRYPASMNSSRLAIRYAEQGGAERDGQVEIRRGVKDLDLGPGTNYAQVRILVDDSHYIKGMAIYGDDKDFPPGVDIIFNSNKSINKSPNKLDYLKPIDDNIKKDPDNPFGSAIKENKGQSYYDDPNGKYTDPETGHKQSLSLINKRADEGDWYSWKDKLPSQFLSKQPPELIKKQLKESLDEKQSEFDDIMALTNPTLKRSFLLSYADDCDSASVHLKAAPLPGQKYQVILPLPSLSDNEVYAPNFKDGSTVALVRFPHAGTYEIPIVKVNNRNEEGIKNLSASPKDAIGINANVASRLSGADFDGDTVMVIPITNRTRIKNREELEGLKGFDTKQAYGPDPKETYTDNTGTTHYVRNGVEYKLMTEKQKQTQMGIVSNLITDMTLIGATDDELVRATKHSMVVIDAVKHKLDYAASARDNGIAELKAKYQRRIDPVTGELKEGGASTLLSRAKSPLTIPERKEGAMFTKDTHERVEVYDVVNNKPVYINPKTKTIVPNNNVKKEYFDPKTGEKVYTNTNDSYEKVKYKNSLGKTAEASVFTRPDGTKQYKDDKGNFVTITNEKTYTKQKTSSVSQMEYYKDARDLSRGYIQEEIYADYANGLKDLARRARVEAYNTGDIEYSPSARKVYQSEYDSLTSKLRETQSNAPKERQAQMIANTIVKAKTASSNYLTDEEEKKIKQQAIAKARKMTGAKRSEIMVTAKEWEAIQAGAIPKSKLKEIIDHANTELLKQYAMPRNTSTVSAAKEARMRSMVNSGYTTAEIADALGLSTSTVIKTLKGKGDN